MNIIEQQIRKYIKKRRILEAGNKSGYDINIPGTMLAGDLKRWRVERINQQAKDNGCDRGFLIVATKREKTADDSLLMNDIVNTIKTIETYTDTYGDDYRIILSNPVQRGKRKIYAAWIIDLRTSKPTPFRELLAKLQDIQKTTSFQLPIPYQQYTLGSTEIINQSKAIGWTDAIADYIKILKTKPWFYTEFPKNNKRSTAQLRSIPNFRNMNRITVPDDDGASEEDITAPKLTTIDNAWKKTNKFPTPFYGTGYVFTDAISGDLTLQPVNGNMPVEDITSGRTGVFMGEFKDGAPWKGETGYKATRADDTYDYEKGETGYTDGDFTLFDGEFTSAIYKINTNSSQKFRFSVTKLKGIQYYNRNNDEKASKFVGEFKNNIVYNGSWQERKTKSGPYIEVAKIVNGAYIAIKNPVELKTVTYPHKIINIGSLTGKTAYISSNNTLSNYVYIWVTNKNAWAEILKSDFEQYVNAQIKETEFLKKITWINNITSVPADISAKEGTSYVELTTAGKIAVYDKSGEDLGNYFQIAADGKKLIWTGETASGKQWYAVHIKDDKGKILPDVFWIPVSIVAKEIPFIK